MQCATQTSAVRLEVDRLKRELEELAAVSPDQVTAAVDATETNERSTFLKDKLHAHQKWVTNLQQLLASAPLLDLALRIREPRDENEETKADTAEPDNTHLQETVDDWRHESTESHFSRLLISRHIKRAVALSQENARKLLDEFETGECEFAVNFHSRGWSHAANVDAGLLTFRSTREISSRNVGAIALAVWRSLQLDDILRTFVPLVHDATAIFESESQTSFISQRVLQLDTVLQSKPVTTIESMEMVAVDSVHGWQIVVETCDDPCLVAYAADRVVRESSSRDHLSSFSFTPSASLATKPDLVIAIRCCPHSHSNGVYLHIAGCIHHAESDFMTSSIHVDLVQYLVDTMPLYEELHLLART